MLWYNWIEIGLTVVSNQKKIIKQYTDKFYKMNALLILVVLSTNEVKFKTNKGALQANNLFHIKISILNK